MVDKKAKEKLRKKLNKLVEEKKQECPEKNKNTIRSEVTKELRDKRKEKKYEKHANDEIIKEEVKIKMGDSDKKEVEKAINQALAKHYSNLKRAKWPSHIRKQKVKRLISDLWCPKDKTWFDDECIKKFEELRLLAAMVGIYLPNGPQNLEKLFPDVCQEYFEFLAKKRFNFSDVEEVKSEMVSDQGNKFTSVVPEKFDEEEALNPNQTESQKVLLSDVLRVVLKNIRKSWKPSHKSWFDGDCQEAFKSLKENAENSNLDLHNNLGDNSKFRLENKEVSKHYFCLLELKEKNGF